MKVSNVSLEVDAKEDMNSQIGDDEYELPIEEKDLAITHKWFPREWKNYRLFYKVKNGVKKVHARCNICDLDYPVGGPDDIEIFRGHSIVCEGKFGLNNRREMEIIEHRPDKCMKEDIRENEKRHYDCVLKFEKIVDQFDDLADALDSINQLAKRRKTMKNIVDDAGGSNSAAAAEDEEAAQRSALEQMITKHLSDLKSPKPPK